MSLLRTRIWLNMRKWFSSHAITVIVIKIKYCKNEYFVFFIRICISSGHEVKLMSFIFCTLLIHSDTFGMIELSNQLSLNHTTRLNLFQSRLSPPRLFLEQRFSDEEEKWDNLRAWGLSLFFQAIRCLTYLHLVRCNVIVQVFFVYVAYPFFVIYKCHL